MMQDTSSMNGGTTITTYVHTVRWATSHQLYSHNKRHDMIIFLSTWMDLIQGKDQGQVSLSLYGFDLKFALLSKPVTLTFASEVSDQVETFTYNV